MQNSSFSALLPRYRAFLLDSYGVLRHSGGVFAGAAALLRQLSTPGASPFWIVTNDASIPPSMIAAKLAVDPSRVISCGEMLSRHLSVHHAGGSRIAYLGRPESEHYLREGGCVGVPVADVRAGDPIAALALMDDEGFDWPMELNHAVNLLRDDPALPFYAPNPDLLYQADAKRIAIGPGALVGLIEAASSRKAIAFGKPSRGIFELALERARRVLPDLRADEALMVGDMLDTDIRGARELGIVSCLVLSGNTRPADLDREIARAGLKPDWVARSVWE